MSYVTSTTPSEANSQASFDNAGFVVNFAPKAVAGLPEWMWLAGLALAAWLLLKKRR